MFAKLPHIPWLDEGQNVCYIYRPIDFVKSPSKFTEGQKICKTDHILDTALALLLFFIPSDVKIPRVKTTLKVKRKAEVVTLRR